MSMVGFKFYQVGDKVTCLRQSMFFDADETYKISDIFVKNNTLFYFLRDKNGVSVPMSSLSIYSHLYENAEDLFAEYAGMGFGDLTCKGVYQVFPSGVEYRGTSYFDYCNFDSTKATCDKAQLRELEFLRRDDVNSENAFEKFIESQNIKNLSECNINLDNYFVGDCRRKLGESYNKNFEDYVDFLISFFFNRSDKGIWIELMKDAVILKSKLAASHNATSASKILLGKGNYRNNVTEYVYGKYDKKVKQKKLFQFLTRLFEYIYRNNQKSFEEVDVRWAESQSAYYMDINKPTRNVYDFYINELTRILANQTLIL